MKQTVEAHYLAALKAGKNSETVEPRAISAKYDAKFKRLVINLRSGATFLLPVKLVEGMENATRMELFEVEILGNGAALHWDAIDVDLSVSDLLMGVFGTKTWMSRILSEFGKVGGSKKSPAKAKPLRKNGKLGGASQ